jgi:hypothetical protein
VVIYGNIKIIYIISETFKLFKDNMKFIKFFENFSDEKTLYIFDMDDTILDSPRIEEQIYDYLNEDLDIKYFLDLLLNQINANLSDLKYDNGRYYIDDPKNKIDIKNTDWIRKKERIYLTAPEKYYYSDLSFPKSLTEVGELYKKVENKAIVTARYEKIRYKVEEYLEKLGIDTPNYGLYCYPGINNYHKRASAWKGDIIVNLIKDNNFKKAIFYDDTSKTVRAVRKIVSEKLPNVDFKAIKVKGWWT